MQEPFIFLDHFKCFCHSSELDSVKTIYYSHCVFMSLLLFIVLSGVLELFSTESFFMSRLKWRATSSWSKWKFASECVRVFHCETKISPKSRKFYNSLQLYINQPLFSDFLIDWSVVLNHSCPESAPSKELCLGTHSELLIPSVWRLDQTESKKWLLNHYRFGCIKLIFLHHKLCPSTFILSCARLLFFPIFSHRSLCQSNWQSQSYLSAHLLAAITSYTDHPLSQEKEV